jgi:hypothetical protein
MSNPERVAFAESAKSDYGLPAVLAALELPHSTWYYHQKQREGLRREICGPTTRATGGHRPRKLCLRLSAHHGRNQGGTRSHHKVVQRLHQGWGLPLIRNIKPPKPSGIRQAITAAGESINLVAEKEKMGPFEVAYADFTELIYADGRCKARLIPIIDHDSR